MEEIDLMEPKVILKQVNLEKDQGQAKFTMGSSYCAERIQKYLAERTIEGTDSPIECYLQVS